MTTLYELAAKVLLHPTDIDEYQLQTCLQKTMTSGIDYADIYLQYSQHESWVLEEGIVKKGSFTIDQGLGVRAVSGDKTGYAFSDELKQQSLMEASRYARNIAKQGQTGILQVAKVTAGQELYPAINPLGSLTDAEKIDVLHRADIAARKIDKRVQQVITSLSGSYKVVLIMTSDGTIVPDVRPLVSFNISVIVEEDGRRESGSYGCGIRADYRFFLTEDKIENYAKEAVRLALVSLSAIPTPAGMMPVVLGNGWPAVMLHEAVGHGLEADFNRKKTSVYSGKIGEKVASELCTVIDQGNLPGGIRGSMNIDDEGSPSQKTVLIENGILRSYMQDKLNARLMGVKSTGNGRRSSYANIPIPRMTTTYFLAGKHDPAEIIASVDKGIYAVNFSGGQVDITSGEFVFSASEAYLIEKGQVTRPVKGATLIGNGPAVLNKITMMGNDLAFDPGIGVCSKDGQSVAVGVGQPTLKISELTVGGTEA